MRASLVRAAQFDSSPPYFSGSLIHRRNGILSLNQRILIESVQDPRQKGHRPDLHNQLRDSFEEDAFTESLRITGNVNWGGLGA